ncbi:TetR/AcrR family transcriptional regulator [Marinitenerispora sediminis]|uniref:TetR family transcriptional regulator n=1 Tax=Marinitenerispora sediminis TaxID=1931232 RepID=A0A368T0C6_9ACTN|nr:TetR family transcriptional regulator C-terminal domain-containing protein [Marinitenerispora sediminis]RCV48366.1 TetR family transcriptional regulator [Marinitenerispora sediminis]RCV49759.1 TetR family transcriptional regulator [Marinitenerispora sediminis]RCV52561.1 TetR family transcriptional regulator [Marinitenerispora sediminis]
MERATGSGRRRVAEALWATIVREGVGGVSVRAVAAEAGVTGGTVQYYFRTRAEMLRYAMELIAERVERRLSAMPRSGPAREWTRAILLELLPLDAERHHEFSVWLAFSAYAGTDPALADLKRRTAARQRELYRHLIRARRASAEHPETGSRAISDAVEEAEAAILHAVVDGLALHLADLGIDEAAALGPHLLDHHLARSIDAPRTPEGFRPEG